MDDSDRDQRKIRTRAAASAARRLPARVAADRRSSREAGDPSRSPRTLRRGP
jgi:hypothetical protein